MKLLTVLGSLQRRSSNRALLERIASSPPGGVEFVAAMALDELPHYNADLDADDPPRTVRRWRDQLRAADGVLFASPEYAHNLPGTLKNALDWIVGSGELVGKAVAATCAAQGPGRGLLGLASLVQTLKAVDAKVVWSRPVIVLRTSLNEHGKITEPTVLEELDSLVATLAREVERMDTSSPS